jgi:agmatine deiminase
MLFLFISLAALAGWEKTYIPDSIGYAKLSKLKPPLPMPPVIPGKEPMQTYTRQASYIPPPPGSKACAEFGPQQGVIISWITYPISLLGIDTVFVDIVRHLAPEDTCWIIVEDSFSQIYVEDYLFSRGLLGGNVIMVNFFGFPCWTRDYCPISVRDLTGNLHFVYSRGFPTDTFGHVFAELLGIPAHPLDIVMEGGNFLTDGCGTCVMTDWTYDENLDRSIEEIDSMLTQYFGCERIIVFSEFIEHIHPHIDLSIKFLDTNVVVIHDVAASVYPDAHAALEAAAAVFDTLTAANGLPYEIYRIEGADPCASYINSAQINNTLFVPQWGNEFDSMALATYRTMLSGFEVVPIDMTWLGPGGGAVHCMTMEVGVRYIPTVIVAEPAKPLPAKMQIKAYPNPFNSAVTISLDCRGLINQTPTVEIFDINGRQVAEIPVGNSVGDGSPVPSSSGRGDLAPTNETVIWSPDESVGSGVFFIRVDSSKKSITKRVVYLK